MTGDLRQSASGALYLDGTETAPRSLLMPPLAEAHVHLDKCHSIGRIGGHDGTLMGAINAQYADKAHWSEGDLRARAGRGLRELAQAGCGLVRSHVDWAAGEAEEPPLAWHVLRELSQEAESIDLQIAPLISVSDHAHEGLSDRIAQTIAPTGAALGCFVYTQADRESGIRAAMRAADRYGLPLDFHVDEGLEPGLDGLEIIARTAIEMGFEGPILCGHACVLMNHEGEALSALADLIARAGITVCALPSTNLYLQGRGDGTPDRRGITRLHELAQAGVRVIIGTDNVRDAFCPLNRHDPRYSLALACLGAHLDAPMGDHLRMITTDARRAMGRDPLFIDQAKPESLLLYPVPTVTDLLCDPAPPHPLIQGDSL